MSNFLSSDLMNLFKSLHFPPLTLERLLGRRNGGNPSIGNPVIPSRFPVAAPGFARCLFPVLYIVHLIYC